MKKIIIKGWTVKIIENNDGTDPTKTKVSERGTITVEVSEVSASCNRQLLASAYLDCAMPKTFGEASSAIDRAFEAAFSVMNEHEIAEIAIEMPGQFVHKSLEAEIVYLNCHCNMEIISNGKRVYEYSPIEVLNIGGVYKNLSSDLISVGCQFKDYPKQLSAFYLLKRALQWLTIIHPNELKEDSEHLLLLKRQCYSNLALLQLNFGNFTAVEKAATIVIAEDKNNVKAFYRRAIANIHLQNYGLAKSDLKMILSMEPNNKAAKAQMEILEKKSSELDQHYAQAMKKFLNL